MERWWVAHEVAAHKAGAEVSPVSIRLVPGSKIRSGERGGGGWQGGESRRGFLVVARWKWWSRREGRGVTESVFDTGGWGMDWEAMVVGTARG
ncbi:hypothetical protein Acr_18g0002340 [Actinidia rufa]|uniref:Uncharacterized protein n=1 Tax=Actinidia rufa TaxID=165716 RepID=A0A7J0G5J1_9ERIC|nr:hypothetical protein Acr_18g0002340 [Actinidia rufa]